MYIDIRKNKKAPGNVEDCLVPENNFSDYSVRFFCYDTQSRLISPPRRLTASTPVSTTARVIHWLLAGIIPSTYVNGMRLALALTSRGNGWKSVDRGKAMVS